MADEDKTVKLGVADYRITSFDPGVRGAPAIANVRTGGTAVPEKHVAAVEKAAEKRGVKLIKL